MLSKISLGLSDLERTFFDVIVDHAARDQNRPAIVGLESDPISFGKLVAQIGGVWDVLRDAGVGYGSKVAIAIPSGLELAVCTVAIASHATCVPLNPRLTLSEFERELAMLSLDALIVPAWLDSPVRAAAENGSFGLFEASKVATSASNFGLRCARSVKKKPRTDPAEISTSSPVLILRTSATTGAAKLVPVTHRNMLDLASKMAGWFGLTTEDRAACVLPTYYAAGSKLNVLVPLLLGESIAIPTGVRSERLTEWISELRPTWFSAGPTFLQAALDELLSTRSEVPKGVLRFVTSGSAHLSARVRTELEAILDCPILEVYGISEAGVMAANPAPPAKRKSGTAGLIAAGELVIRGPTGLPVPTGKTGEIFVTGPGLMPGYGDGETLGAGLQDGWLQTGDVGFVDPDGFLTLVGRTKEMINRGGEKVSPNEIERALLLHPCVREAAAFGVPHPRLGENVAAAVTLQPGYTTTALELKSFLRSHLAAFKIPQRIDILASLLKNHTGKVLKSQLAEAFISSEHHIEPPEKLREFQILEIWQRLLQRTDIGIHDDFFEVGGNSLLATQMLLEVEGLLGRRLSKSDVAEASTIRELAAIAAINIGDSDELVTEAKKGEGQPLFFCHGDFDTHGLYALKLAALLQRSQPVYLIHPLLDVTETSQLAIEDLARLYLPRLLALQPHGAFLLGGFCNGGLLAWEIAHQLLRAGREVATVVLIDSLSLNSRPLFRGLHHLFNGLAAITWPQAVERILRHEAMPVVWKCTRESQGSTYRWLTLAVQSLRNLIARSNGAANYVTSLTDKRNVLYFRAMANYAPPKLDCTVIAVACEHSANIFEWSTKPWNGLASVVHHIVVPGEHRTCITNHVEALARALNAQLNSARSADFFDPRPNTVFRHHAGDTQFGPIV